MAPGVCVTSFRMLLRHKSSFGHFGRTLPLTVTPLAATITVNSWSISRRNYCSEKSIEGIPHSGNTKNEKTADTVDSEKKANINAANVEVKKSTNISKAIPKSKVTNLKTFDFSNKKVHELKTRLRILGLSDQGKKEILIQRLQAYQEPKQDFHNQGKQNATCSSERNEGQDKCEEFETNLSSLDGIFIYGAVEVEYIQGLPHLTIPLPSRNEKCRFALKPVSHKVGDLINMLKIEDRGIDRANVFNKYGIRISSTSNIESLMDEPFWLQINDKKYEVVPPPREQMKTEDIQKLGDIKLLVLQLYEALHVGEYHIEKEQELTKKLEDLKYQLRPLERQKMDLAAQAERKISIMTWVGLGLMSVQFGILARLTWWEYSWDIMEPVTYFVTYGTAMAMYAYYCITKQEYNLNEVKDRQYLITMYKRAKKRKFDIEEYNNLKRQVAEIEYDLRRLHDPLNLQLPAHIIRTQENPPSDDAGGLISGADTTKKSGFKFPFLK